MLNSLLWSGTDAIINAHDPMQNLGQTRIFYYPGQTRLTRTKRDPVDPDNPVNPTRFQTCSKHEQQITSIEQCRANMSKTSSEQHRVNMSNT